MNLDKRPHGGDHSSHVAVKGATEGLIHLAGMRIPIKDDSYKGGAALAMPGSLLG